MTSMPPILFSAGNDRGAPRKGLTPFPGNGFARRTIGPYHDGYLSYFLNSQKGAAMNTEGSVTHWLDWLRAGDQDAAQPLWERYFRQVVLHARARLREAPRRAADEEDVALSAFDSFCRGAERGRFPRLADRDVLWRLLVTITARKACKLIRDQKRLKRDPPGHEAVEFEDVVGEEPTPEFASQVAEETQRLLALLDQSGDADQRRVALRKMEGYTVDEIAADLDCAPRTAARKLALVRKLWEHEVKS
jgi:DNA-directed RNA polymerase specialized sigma24 family protein